MQTISQVLQINLCSLHLHIELIRGIETVGMMDRY